jgi:N-formylglutamate amidohydrolase
MKRLLIAALALIVLFPATDLRAADDSRLVEIRFGTLPILLTAPHGGSAAVPGVEPRTVEGRSRAGATYVVTTDLGTDVITEVMARELEKATGKKPYVVIARFARRFIDANRPQHIAYDSPAAKPVYDLYHRAIRDFVDEIRTRYGEGLLIDVHGQSKMRVAMVRGTLNGRTITRLLARSGASAMIGPAGLFGQLEAQGFVVFPANAVPIGGTSEDPGFNGGHTVARYGSHLPDGIDAVQLEIGADLRRRKELSKTGERVGRAVSAFYAAHLPPPQR